MLATETPPDPPVEQSPVPVNLLVDYPDRLSRWKLFVKWLFVWPLFFWLALYGILAAVVTFIAFWAILVSGTYPLGLFNFVSGYIATQYRVSAYFPLLLSDKWQTGDPHPIRLELAPPRRVSRLLMVFVKVPAYALGGINTVATFGLGIAMLAAMPAWLCILITGKYPRSLFNFVFAISQWSARLTAWQFLLHDGWSLFGTTRKVRVITILGAVLFSASTPILLLTSFSGSFVETIGAIAGVDDAKVVVNEFMVAGEQRNLDTALTLMAPGVTNRAELTRLFNQRPLFDGFRSTKVTGFNIQSATGQGTTLELEGDVSYSTGPKGSFYALMLKDAGEWKILTISINR